MGIIGNTPLAGKQTHISPEEEKSLFNAGISYLTNGAPEAAYYCFERTSKSNIHVLFNKALCCYEAEWYEGCHRLLAEAEQLLPTYLPRQELLPPPLSHKKYGDRIHFCPMPWETPRELVNVQVLRLKAETAFKLHLYNEVKEIAATLQKPYRHIEELIKQINNEIERH